jgi:uncharacterized membrane protein YhaH (DUF805 family)
VNTGPVCGRPARRRETLDRIGVVVYGVVDWLVIMAPSLAIRLASDRGGLGDSKGLDLFFASLAVATPHAVIAARRLRDEERLAVWRADIWIASLDSLVVLALSTTLLIVTVLAVFADEHAALANRGYPVVVLWLGLQLVAVALAEATGRFVFWWLEPHREDRLRHPSRYRPEVPAAPAGEPSPSAPALSRGAASDGAGSDGSAPSSRRARHRDRPA